MTVFIDSKFKEQKPLATVNQIRNALFNAGIFTVETWINSGIKGCYSVRVEIAGTNIGQNGKGVTREFALASGYAEFMERLQTGYIYIGKQDEELEAEQGFLHVPEEKEFTVDEYMEQYGQVLKGRTNDENELKELLRFCTYETVYDKQKDFVAVPFRQERTGSVVYLPFPLLKDVFATNGTCAGNTKKEALVQGFSEIMERNHNLRILKECITPPTIPDTYLQTFAAYEMIEEIRKEENCDLIIKDCSLGTGFPVVAAVLISRKSHKYIVKFGAHPVFEIALERTLTEMLQGRSIADAINASEISYSISEVRSYDNIHNVLKNASGRYHYSFFGKEEQPFVPFADRTEMNNQQLYDYCISVFDKKGYEVYIRECGYAGFPAYQIIIPGFSEIYNYGKTRLKEKISWKKSSEILLNLDRASDKEINTLFLYLRYKEGFSMENTLSYTLRQPLLLEQNQDMTDYFYIHLCVSMHLKKWKEVFSCAKILQHLNKEKQDLYDAVQEIAKGMLQEGNLNELLRLAKVLYSVEVIDEIRNIIDWEICSRQIADYCRLLIADEKINAYPIYKKIKSGLKKMQGEWNESIYSTKI